MMSQTDTGEIKRQLDKLRTEHRDLDDVLRRLSESNAVDQLMVRRLKKRKLLLKDMISKLESQLLPDITA